MAIGKDKRSVGSPCGEASGQGAATLPPRVKDALLFLIKVKDIFQDKPGKYTELLRALNDLKDQRTNLARFSARVKELIKDHHELIPGFNSFLPKGYEITLSPEEEFEIHLKRYVDEVYVRFQHDKHTTNRFDRIIGQYLTMANKVFEEIAVLFKHHQDLVEEFSGFLRKIPAKKQRVDPDIKQVKGRLQHKSVPARILDQWASLFQDKKESYDELLGTLNDLKNQRITLASLVARWKELLKNNRDLLGCFNFFLPEGYKITLPPEKNSANLPLTGIESTLRFHQTLLARLRHDELSALIRIPSEYSSGIKSADEVLKSIVVLLKDNQDLLEGLIGFLPDTIHAKPPTQAVPKTPQSKKPAKDKPK